MKKEPSWTIPFMLLFVTCLFLSSGVNFVGVNGSNCFSFSNSCFFNSFSSSCSCIGGVSFSFVVTVTTREHRYAESNSEKKN